VGFYFYFLFFFLYYQLHHHYLLTLILTTFTLPPYPVLSIVLLPNNFFCPFSSTLSLYLHLPLLVFPNHTMPPSYTLTTCWLTYCTNFIQPQTPAIPDTSSLYYNNKNTPKYPQGPQNPAASISLPPLTHPTSCLSFSTTLISQISILPP
jgi:hypothetical protein